MPKKSKQRARSTAKSSKPKKRVIAAKPQKKKRQLASVPSQPKPSPAAAINSVTAAAAESAKQRYVQDLLTRGEAAPLDPSGKLPRDATHQITGQNPDGSPIVKTVRLKTY